MLIGLTGRNASGKSTIVNWFAEKGLKTASCSDSIRTWLAEQNIESTRDALIEGGRELRRQGGAGVLAEMLLQMLDGEDAVIDSIRTPGEVEALRERDDFILVEVGQVQIQDGNDHKVVPVLVIRLIERLSSSKKKQKLSQKMLPDRH